MQLLLRRQAGSISDTEWLELLKLEAHLDDFVKDPEMIDSGMGTKWQDIQLMGQAALAFSGVSQPLGLVQSLVARERVSPPVEQG
ncbi:MAG: hypothetical protein LQ338_000915 [Usnochroma carphineum]|nr:MAG: hypothetical protein LQ338_000915 [Usnochroma carphineum]